MSPSGVPMGIGRSMEWPQIHAGASRPSTVTMGCVHGFGTTVADGRGRLRIVVLPRRPALGYEVSAVVCEPALAHGEPSPPALVVIGELAVLGTAAIRPQDQFEFLLT